MSKQNKDLAAKIVDELGQFDKTDEGTAVNFTDTILPYHAFARADTKKEARQNAIDGLAADLDSGALVLADDWAANNLG